MSGREVPAAGVPFPSNDLERHPRVGVARAEAPRPTNGPAALLLGEIEDRPPTPLRELEQLLYMANDGCLLGRWELCDDAKKTLAINRTPSPHCAATATCTATRPSTSVTTCYQFRWDRRESSRGVSRSCLCLVRAKKSALMGERKRHAVSPAPHPARTHPRWTAARGRGARGCTRAA